MVCDEFSKRRVLRLGRIDDDVAVQQHLLDRFAPASVLNYRQVALIVAMRKHPDMFHTIAGHRRSHNVSYQTARTDLFKLAELHLATAAKRSRTFVFSLVEDFDERLRELADRSGLRRRRIPPPT